MGKKKTKEKTKIIIRCTPETKRKFRMFVASKGFRNSEEALLFLLEFYEKPRVEVEVFGPEREV